MHSIGEFSRITGLSIKALRLYHDRGLLMPSHVDEDTGYRYYRSESVDKGRAISRLRALTFSLDEIQEIVGGCEEDAAIVSFLESKGDEIARKMGDLERIASSIAAIVKVEKESIAMTETNEFDVEERLLDDRLIASIRWKGRYDEAGKYFGALFRRVGMQVCGKPFNLYYDGEFLEQDADCESCVPVRKGKSNGDVKVRTLSGGRALCLIHRGSYSELGRSYGRLFAYAQEHELSLKTVPSREIYRKGPGLIFKGNPNNYLTEIQFLIAGKSES